MRTNQKLTILAAVAAMSLAACTVPADPAPAPAVTVTETAAPEPQETLAEPVEDDLDAEFISDIELYEDNWRAYGSEEQVIQLGMMACEYFEAGGDLFGYTEVAVESDLDTDFATTVAASALTNYCPELKDQVIGG